MDQLKLTLGAKKQQEAFLIQEETMKTKDYQKRMEEIRQEKSKLAGEILDLEMKLAEKEVKEIYADELIPNQAGHGIPEKMPYCLNDILTCKDIDMGIVYRDYEALKKFDGETNPRKMCGNKTLYQYQFRELLKCRRDSKGYKTLEEWFGDPELKEKLWKDSVRRNRNDKAPYPSPVDVYECHRINNGAICLFKPSTAKYIYKKFGAKSVLDPTMGWGGRMLGATPLGIHYTGFDTNIDLRRGYENMIKDLKLEKTKLFWETSLNEDIIKTLDYDIVLTSPPYVNLELYEHMTPWKSDDEFYLEFLIPLINLCHKYLKEGGHSCWNISPKMYKKLTQVYKFRECDTQEDLRQQLGKQYKTKSQDYIYIWKK